MRARRHRVQLTADVFRLALELGQAATSGAGSWIPGSSWGLVTATFSRGESEGRGLDLGVVVEAAHGDGLGVVDEAVGVGAQAHQALQAAEEHLWPGSRRVSKLCSYRHE